MIAEKENPWVEEALSKIQEKMEVVSDRSKDKIPYTTINGVHDDRLSKDFPGGYDAGVNWWTNGFWGGMLWLMYHETGEEKYAEYAGILIKRLDRCFEVYYGLHHDVGFMYMLSAVADYRITGNEESKKRGLHAANLLAGRFNPAGRFIRAWNSWGDRDCTGWAIIDCMMNLHLLYWASEETKDPRFRQIAMLHADTAMEHFIRPDGSAIHIVEFDPETGMVLRTQGGQGYEDGSSWTRGQAWALYGFVLSYIHTKKAEYLDTAKKVAHYFIANIPESNLIPVDFRQPEEPAWEDSSAAAVAACGLLELAKQVGELERDMYRNAALRLLKALYEKRSNWSLEEDGIIEKCSSSYHVEKHHFNLVYGDYYFMEAMFKLKGNDILLW